MAFYLTGLTLSLLMGWMAFNLHRREDIASAGED
jgi:hypothetical protein